MHPQPSIDVAAYAHELEEAMGADAFAALQRLSSEEKESLRFEAEHGYAQSRSVRLDANKHLSEILQKQRLPEISAALTRAEDLDDQAEIDRLKGVHKLLTTRIAEIGRAV
jgi:hypothetical protein